MFVPGRPMELTVTAEISGRELSFTASGPVPEQAKNAGAERDSVAARLQKTGGTRFRMEDTEIDLAPGLFLPVGQLNALRRDALAGLEQEILDLTRRKMQPPAENSSFSSPLSAAVCGSEARGKLRASVSNCSGVRLL